MPPAPSDLSAPEILAAALRSTPFHAVTAVAALVSLVLGGFAFWRTHLQGAKLSFQPADSVGLVRGPLGGLSSIHVMGALVNLGGRTGILQRLEADVTDPSGVTRRFVWDQFYRYKSGATLAKATDPHPLAVKAGDATQVQVQLVPADGKLQFDISAGEYRVRVLGWVSAKDRNARPKVNHAFRIAVDRKVVDDLSVAGDPHKILRVAVVEWRHPDQVRPSFLDKIAEG
jgi:hypothetical protein